MTNIIFIISIVVAYFTRKYVWGFFGLLLSKFFESSQEKSHFGDRPEEKEIKDGWNARKYYDYMSETYPTGMFSDSLGDKSVRGCLLFFFWFIILYVIFL